MELKLCAKLTRDGIPEAEARMSDQFVLVVEDDPVARSDAALMLEEAGLDVISMDNADEALAFIYEQPERIAGVFSDINMPGHLSGLHLAETVARHWPKIPIVLSSGRVHPSWDLPASVRFLPKPWLPLDVLTAMQVAAA